MRQTKTLNYTDRSHGTPILYAEWLKDVKSLTLTFPLPFNARQFALSRDAGVSACEIFNIRLGKKSEDDFTPWQHCWTEFSIPAYGWVAVDPADVHKAMLNQRLPVSG